MWGATKRTEREWTTEAAALALVLKQCRPKRSKPRSRWRCQQRTTSSLVPCQVWSQVAHRIKKKSLRNPIWFPVARRIHINILRQALQHAYAEANKSIPLVRNVAKPAPRQSAGTQDISVESSAEKICRENGSCAEKKGMTSKFIHHRLLKTSTQNNDVKKKKKKKKKRRRRGRLID